MLQPGDFAYSRLVSRWKIDQLHAKFNPSVKLKACYALMKEFLGRPMCKKLPNPPQPTLSTSTKTILNFRKYNVALAASCPI